MLARRIAHLFGHPDVAVVFAVFTVMAFGSAVVGPIMGELQSSFDVPLAVLGLVLSAPAIARVVLTIPSGIMSDRLPPRVLLSTGTLLMSIGSVVCATAPSFTVLVGGSLIAGLGSALVFTPGMSHIARLSQGQNRGHATGRIMAGVQLGGLFSPAAAGLAATLLNWRAAYIIAAVVGVIATGLIWTQIRSPQPSAQPSTSWSWHPSSLGISKGLLGIASFAVLLWGATFTVKRLVIPLYGSVALNLDPAAIGIVMTIAAAIRTATMFASGPILTTFGRHRVLMMTTTLSVTAALLLILPATLWLYGALALLYAIGGIVTALPPVLVAERTPRENVGRAMGSMQFMVDLLLLAFPPMIGLMIDTGGFPLVGITSAAMFAGALVAGLRIMGK
jgi:MFS family permease